MIHFKLKYALWWSQTLWWFKIHFKRKYDPDEFDDPSVFDYPNLISNGSMEFDNPSSFNGLDLIVADFADQRNQNWLVHIERKMIFEHEPWGNWKEHLSSFSTLAWLSTSPLLHLSNLASTCCCNSTLLPNPCGPNIVLDSTVFWSLHKFPPYHLFFPNSGFPSHVLLVLTFQVLGWVGSHVVSSLGLSGRATAIMNPIKALGLNDGGGLASPTIIGPHGQLARHQQPIIAIKSIRALSLARKPFELAAHGWLDQ